MPAQPATITYTATGELVIAARCQWFALCGQPATGTTPHPAFPDGVPTCDRCAYFAEHGEFLKEG